ncbi:hypothetical protein FACS1894155_12310 [Bacteroidia bacterium]|nr:hypothetical protein FACS1894155_12310 [Bacteroidia bacterium]
MKKLVYVLIAMFMVACGSNTSKTNYEKTISEYLLKGQSNDYNFKVVELTEQGNVTVADSIAYLTDEFRKDKQLIVSRIELARKMSEDLQAKTKLKSEFDKYANDIARMNNSIDSLKNLAPDNLQGYDSRNANDVLVKIVRCKYSVQPPGASPVEETFDFYLSPDGSKCYGKTRAK